jgi:23S rRNA (cytosine1962-C5)-methyltransferase
VSASAEILDQLEKAWLFRERKFCFRETEALRVFHGPAEGEGFLSRIAIDLYGPHAWVTEWEGERKQSREGAAGAIVRFLQSKSLSSAVALFRPEREIPAEPEILFGDPPMDRYPVREHGARFWIRLREVKHPGLFLDHLPLREWLVANSKGQRILNTFAYTGSLSIAAGIGGALHVTTLDLSRPTIEWAKENWSLNELSNERGDFIFGDYFEWLPKMARRDQRFDCVILDPPSFSRGKKGNFSTSKDLQLLHELALDVLEPNGILVTSLNSANVSKKKYWAEISAAAQSKGASLQPIQEISLPESFPVPAGSEPYLKGWILRRSENPRAKSR